MARLVQVAAVEPQLGHLRRLPHVAQLALPRTRVLRRVGAQAPALADLVGDLGRDQVGQPAVHRAVARGVHQQVGRQLGAVGERDRVCVHALDVHAALEVDAAVGHQLRGAHVDVVARAAPQVLHEQARAVHAEVEQEAGLLQPRVQVGVALLHLLVHRDVEGVHDLVGHRGEDQVALVVVDAALHRLLGIQAAQRQLHERLRGRDVRGRALHHRHVGAVLPQRRADVVRRVVRAQHHALLARIGLGPGVLAGVVLVAQEVLGARHLRHVRVARHAEREHQLLRAQRHGLALALHLHLPALRGLVEARLGRVGGAPVVELHDLRVHLEPVADLVLGREHRPVVGEGHVGQVVVPDRVVQAQRLVALAPGVAGLGVALHDDRRHAQPPQPRPQRDAALAAADDHHLGLLGVAQRGLFVAALLEPVLAALVHAVLRALDAVVARLLLEALQFGHRGEQRPGLAVTKAYMAAPARHARLEGEPCIDHALGLGRFAFEREGRGLRVGQARLQHRADGARAFLRADVPGEGDEVAPVAVGLEQRDGRIDVAACERGGEVGQPLGGGPGGAGGRVCHCMSPLCR
ncbi:hypothetical protein D9M72_327850 [compost metagenome]